MLSKELLLCNEEPTLIVVTIRPNNIKYGPVTILYPVILNSDGQYDAKLLGYIDRGSGDVLIQMYAGDLFAIQADKGDASVSFDDSQVEGVDYTYIANDPIYGANIRAYRDLTVYVDTF